MYRNQIIHQLRNTKRQQGGVVLMAGLIILLTLTLIGLALIRLSVVELKVAGASQRYQILFNDAEALVALYFSSNRTNLVDGCLSNVTTGSATTLPTSPTVDQCRYVEGVTNNNSNLVFANTVLTIPNILTDFGRVNLVIEQMNCIDSWYSQANTGQANDATAPSAVFFNIQAQAWDQLDNDASVRIHTGIVAQMPPGKGCREQGQGDGT